MTNAQNHIFLSALRWHMDIGADEMWSDTPVDKTASPSLAVVRDTPSVALQKSAPPALFDIKGGAELSVEAQQTRWRP
jgi:hypothetical protein